VELLPLPEELHHVQRQQPHGDTVDRQQVLALGQELHHVRVDALGALGLLLRGALVASGRLERREGREVRVISGTAITAKHDS